MICWNLATAGKDEDCKPATSVLADQRSRGTVPEQQRLPGCTVNLFCQSFPYLSVTRDWAGASSPVAGWSLVSDLMKWSQ
jgi:hypothetical protein